MKQKRSDDAATADDARLRATFAKFDRDQSQSIDLSELADVMANLGVSMTQTQLGELVQQANVNERGELEFEAFAQLLDIWREAAKMKLFDEAGETESSRDKMRSALSTKLLLPDSWGRCVFDALVLVTAVAYYTVILLDDAVQSGMDPPVMAVEIAAVCVFLADMCLSAVTYRGADEPAAALKQYAASWLAVDVLSVFPWGLVFTGATGIVLRHIPFLKLLKISALWRCSGRMPMSAMYITFHYKILPITLLAIFFGIMVHGFTIGLMLVKQAYAKDPLISDGTYPYSAAVYFVIYTLGTVGFGNIDITEANEKLYCCLVLCGSILSNGFVVGKLVAIMQRADLQKDRRGKLRQTLAVLDHFDLPHALQDEVLQFQDHLLGHALGASYASTLNGLPRELHSNINIVVKVRLLSCVQVFRPLHAVVKVALSQALVNVVLVPEQYVLGMGEEVKTMFFIAHGFVDVLGHNGTRIRTLSANAYFAAGMLIENVVSTVSVKALGYCDLWALARNDMLVLASKFPPLRKILTDVAEKHTEFECATATTRAEDTTTRRNVVSLVEAPTTPLNAEDGELEDGANVQQLSRKSERLAALSQRLQSACNRLHEATVHLS
jgi:hypothetical protein